MRRLAAWRTSLDVDTVPSVLHATAVLEVDVAGGELLGGQVDDAHRVAPVSVLLVLGGPRLRVRQSLRFAIKHQDHFFCASASSDRAPKDHQRTGLAVSLKCMFFVTL